MPRTDPSRPDRTVLVIAATGQHDPAAASLDRQAEAAVNGVWAAGSRPRSVRIATLAEPVAGASGPERARAARTVVADAVEAAVATEDAAILLLAPSGPAIAGGILAASRTGLPIVVVPAGCAEVGELDGRTLTALDAAADPSAADVVDAAWPSVGWPPVLSSAFALGVAAELLGWTLPGATDPPALFQNRDRAVHAAAVAAAGQAQGAIAAASPDATAFADALTVLAALGGTDDAVEHLRVVAAARGVVLDDERIAAVLARGARRVDLLPYGTDHVLRYVRAGGTPALLGTLLREAAIAGDTRTPDGRPLRDVVGDAAPFDHDVFRPAGSLEPRLGRPLGGTLPVTDPVAARRALRRAADRALGRAAGGPRIGVIELTAGEVVPGVDAGEVAAAVEDGVAATRAVAVRIAHDLAPDRDAAREGAAVAALAAVVADAELDALVTVARGAAGAAVAADLGRGTVRPVTLLAPDGGSETPPLPRDATASAVLEIAREAGRRAATAVAADDEEGR